jgi:hypothetical protein
MALLYVYAVSVNSTTDNATRLLMAMLIVVVGFDHRQVRLECKKGPHALYVKAMSKHRQMAVFLQHTDIRAQGSGARRGHAADMNEWLELGSGEGTMSDRNWVLVTAGQSGCPRPLATIRLPSQNGH